MDIYLSNYFSLFLNFSIQMANYADKLIETYCARIITGVGFAH